jgi:cytochrome c556
MPSVMQAKLAHAQAVLEGLALADFRQIEVNAAALIDISQHADWLVHDTPSYASLSEHFRAAAQAMVDDAQRRDLAALSRDYGSLTGSCVACHRYLQAERPTLQMPGRVSMRDR